MMDEEYTNRREEILARFRSSLNRPLSERFFDEDDLIEIFDYAGDMGDDYLRMEALLCGARYYPDSQALKERRGIFYSMYSDDTCSKFLEDNSDQEGMLWDVLRVRKNPPASSEDAVKSLDYIISSYDKLSDEEVIQFIELASTLNQLQWIKDNMPLLRRKAEYLNMLLYEVAVVADAHFDFNMGIEMLEELTQIEPFNAYYWIMLGRDYAAIDEKDKALTAIDYALAINPDDKQALFTKARILYVNNAPTSTVIEMMQRVVDDNPDPLDSARFLASLYRADLKPELGSKVLREALRKAPGDILEIVPELITYDTDNIDELLDRFYRQNSDNTAFFWDAWAQQLSSHGYGQQAKAVLAAYERNSGDKLTSILSIEDMFINQKFTEAITALCDFLSDTSNDENDYPSIVAIHVLSMVKTGELLKALAFCQFFRQHVSLTDYKTVSSRLEYLGLRKLIDKILYKLTHSLDPTDWKDFDPLMFWDNKV